MIKFLAVVGFITMCTFLLALIMWVRYTIVEKMLNNYCVYHEEYWPKSETRCEHYDDETMLLWNDCVRRNYYDLDTDR